VTPGTQPTRLTTWLKGVGYSAPVSLEHDISEHEPETLPLRDIPLRSEEKILLLPNSYFAEQKSVSTLRCNYRLQISRHTLVSHNQIGLLLGEEGLTQSIYWEG
jgi:hypothetical protein